MLTTGNSTIDDSFKSANTISSSHTVFAEWNQNAYNIIKNVGSYAIDLTCTASDPTYSKTLNNDQEAGGWDNGEHFYKVNSDNAEKKYIEDKTKKTLASLREIAGVNRPDPGIVYAIGIKPTDPTVSSSQINIIDNSSTIRSYNLTNAENRLYPLNESQSFKYWTSIRNNKENTTHSITSSLVGVSGGNRRMTGNNAFIQYETDLLTNKIVIKTQTINGYPTDFTVQIIRSSDVTKTWSTIYSTTDSTTMNDGILRLTANRVGEDLVWSVAAGTETEAAITDLLIDNVNDVEQIEAIRFSAQKISKVNGTLDIIEISPRLVIDMSSYVSSLSINSTLGDSVLGLPVGSIVSSVGTVSLFNQDNLISNKNNSSILNNLLKPNVKFTVFNKTVSGETTKYIPLKVLYSNSWDEKTDWVVDVELEDYMKFFKDTPSPDFLLGSLDGTRVSAILRILLDNVGFTRFSFVKTRDEEEFDYEDRRINFFYCAKEVSLAATLNDIATSAQISMFIDNFGNLVAMTKEAVSQKTALTDYWLVGDKKNLTISDSEYSILNTEAYMSNIEAFEDTVIPPITSGEVTYQELGIQKMSTQLVKLALKDGGAVENVSDQDMDKILESGFSEVTLNRDLSYVPQQIWKPGGTGTNDPNGYLSAGVLIRNISANRPKDYIQAFTTPTVEAKNKNDAIRLFYEQLTAEQKMGCEIVLSENNMAADFRTKYSGFVTVDSEMIKYNGIIYAIIRPGYMAERKIYFSQQEKEVDIALAPSGSSFIPYALLVDISVKTDSSIGEQYKIYTCFGDGRGYNSTTIGSHYSGIYGGANGWTNFATKLYDTVQPSSPNDLSSFSLLTDVGPTLGDTTSSVIVAGGYAKLSGPKPTDASAPSEAAEKPFFMETAGEQLIVGTKKDCGFRPQRIGTKMMIDGFESKSRIGGFGFYLSDASSGTTGYFLEVSTHGESFNLTSENYNILLYKVVSESGKLVPSVLGKFFAPIVAMEKFTVLVDNMRLNKDSDIVTMDIEVIITGDDNNRIIQPSINGSIMGTVTDTNASTTPATNNIGFMARNDSKIIFDYIHASVIPDGKSISTNDPIFGVNTFYSYKDALARRIFPKNIAGSIATDTEIFFEDFGNLVREARNVEIRFQETARPAFNAKLIELSKVSPDYIIKDFKYSAYGASFWIYNTSATSVIIGDGSPFPVFMSGFLLKEISSGTVKVDDYLKYEEYDDRKNDELEKNKRLYGDQSINITGKYINNYQEANDMAEWIAKNSSKEKIAISATIFPNPLLQIGDKVKLFYKSKGYCESQIGEKSFILSEMQYQVTDSGIDMDVVLREMI